jgi:hypothetical protein
MFRNAVQPAAAVVAVVFGLATILAGLGVLWAGADPGYVVFRPLLVFNTVMGVAYLGAGVVIWKHLRWGRNAAGAILLANLAVAVAVAVWFVSGAEVAVESVRAMALRCGVWLGIFAALFGLTVTSRRTTEAEDQPSRPS